MSDSLPFQLSFFLNDGDSNLSFSHWTYHLESQQYVPHSNTILREPSEDWGKFLQLVIFQDSLFMAYFNQGEEYTIARIDGFPTSGQKAVVPTIKRTFKSLGAMATDGNYLWVGAEAALMLLDHNLENLDQVSLDIGWNSAPHKNAHDILIHQNTAYLLDNVCYPILLFQVKLNSTQKLELVRALEVEGVYIHLDHQWLNPSLNQWVIIESGSGSGGEWQHATIFPMDLVEESEKLCETIGNIDILARTAEPPFWVVIYDPAAGCFLTCFQDLETGTEVSERIPLELKKDFRGGYRVHLEQRDRVLIVTNFLGLELLYYKTFWVFLDNFPTTQPIKSPQANLNSGTDRPTELSNQQLFRQIYSYQDGYQKTKAEGFRVIAATQFPPILAVIFETESQEYFLAAIDSENNQIIVGSKLSLGWETSPEPKIIFRQKKQLLIILMVEYTQSLLIIVDIQETPKIVHRQVLKDNMFNIVEDLLICRTLGYKPE